LILGTWLESPQGTERADAARDWGLDPAGLHATHVESGGWLALASSGSASHDAGHFLGTDPRSGVTVAIYGSVFNLAALAERFGAQPDRPEAAPLAIVLAGYEKLGEEMFRQLNGNFVVAILDPRRRRCWVARDHLGIESLYYSFAAGALHFSSSLRALAARPDAKRELNSNALVRYCLFNYNPGSDTLYEGIEKLRSGHLLKLEGGKLSVERYWAPSFANVFPADKSLESYREELLELLRDAIRIRLGDGRFQLGAYLSGGMDSSTVVGLMRPMTTAGIHTFSFRCRGKSFDESVYARLMSQRYGTIHHEIEFEASDLARIERLAASSDEPFSDIGIEVASFLLAEKAAGQVDFVLTGDGGDELFAGHPVYLADRIAARFDRLPGLLRHPLTAVLQKLPDTDAKKSLPVKLKRFSYSAAFSPDLFSNRWRIYYTDDELAHLLQPAWRPASGTADALREIRALYHDADGHDLLSRTIYGDYQTVVGFYLRRMELVRQFGLEGRMPLLDHRLVDYTGRIPSNLKLSPKGETKKILHDVMAGTLPDEIVFRTDKLGHSVPFKNWLRSDPSAQSLVREVLNPDAVARRGIFDPKFVEELFRRHLNRADNHSHRLWGLLVLELWCRKNLDQRPDVKLRATSPAARDH